MNLEQRIKQDLMEAMKAHDEASKRGLRAVLAAIQLANTDGSGDAIEGDREIKLLQKLVKQRRDSVEIYQKGNRPELAAVELEEIAVIEKYLPQQMSEVELEVALREIIAQTGAVSARDIGKVMGAANKAFAGKAEGKMIAAVAKRLLEGL
jgi:uncharacterized protein YqeY